MQTEKKGQISEQFRKYKSCAKKDPKVNLLNTKKNNMWLITLLQALGRKQTWQSLFRKHSKCIMTTMIFFLEKDTSRACSVYRSKKAHNHTRSHLDVWHKPYKNHTRKNWECIRTLNNFTTRHWQGIGVVQLFLIST